VGTSISTTLCAPSRCQAGDHQNRGRRHLHGEETLKAIVDTGVHMECVVISGVSEDDWDDSDWPEALEDARQIFMKHGGFTIRRAG